MARRAELAGAARVPVPTHKLQLGVQVLAHGVEVAEVVRDPRIAADITVFSLAPTVIWEPADVARESVFCPARDGPNTNCPIHSFHVRQVQARAVTMPLMAAIGFVPVRVVLQRVRTSASRDLTPSGLC